MELKKHIEGTVSKYLYENKDTHFNQKNYELELWGKLEREIFLRYDEIKNSTIINNYEASLIIAADDVLFEEIDIYKYHNTPFTSTSEKKLINILTKVKPVDKFFYRGVEREKYDDNHIMGIQSWSTNKDTARLFGKFIYKTVTPSKGVSISDIYYWNGLINDNSNGLGDTLSEWLLLNPKKTLINR